MTQRCKHMQNLGGDNQPFSYVCGLLSRKKPCDEKETGCPYYEIDLGDSVVISTKSFLQITHDLAEANALISAICEKWNMSKQELHGQYLQEES